METNELQVFEQANMVVFKKLSEFKKQQDLLKKQEEEDFKAQLLKSMEEFGIKSFKNDYVTISHVEASSSTTIDLKALESKEPKLYEDLLNDYPKVTNKKAYVRIVVK